MDSEALLHRERCEYEGGSENIWGEGRRIQQVIKKYKEYSLFHLCLTLLSLSLLLYI